MKVLMKNIEMIAWFTTDGHPTPIRFRLSDNELGNIVIPIHQIMYSEEEKYAGNKMILYKCQSIINNIYKVFEVKYEINTCKWFLYRM